MHRDEFWDIEVGQLQEGQGLPVERPEPRCDLAWLLFT